MTLRKREQLGIELVRSGAVRAISQSSYDVASQNGSGKYDVTWTRNRWTCSCPDYLEERHCKHAYAVQYFLQMRNIIANAEREGLESTCPYCRSAHLIRRGQRYSRTGPTQRYLCKDCKRRFTITSTKRSKSIATVVTAALDLYFRGLSLRETSEHLATYWNCRVAHTTILRWIGKYVRIISESLSDKVALQGDRWDADETKVRLNRRHILFWSLLDDKHRFLIALRVSERQTSRDAILLFAEGLAKTGYPTEIITDGARVYSTAISETMTENPGMIHVGGPGLTSGLTNNRVERLHKSIKGRLRQMGSFHSKRSAENFATGYALYHNYIKEHKALGGRTPAQAAGLRASRESWRSLLPRG